MTEPSPELLNIPDFSESHERVLFRIDADVFEATRTPPGKVLARFAGRFANVEGLSPEKQLDVFADALGMVLLPESNGRFQKRLDDLENPISLEQSGRVIEYLLERYGLRPTEPSSTSSDGPSSPVPGTSLTDAPPLQVSIPATFQPTGS